MFKKNDPLVDSVKAVMEHNAKERQIEAAVNEEFGVTSKNALPHEIRVKYEQRLAEAKKCMYEGKPLVGNQHKIDVANTEGETKPDGKLTSHDFKLLRKKKKMVDEKWHEESSKKKEELDEKLTKSMSAGDIISDFVHSKDPKFKGKSTKMRQKMALGAYYGMHPEKSRKKMEEQAVFEEIRNNLEEQLVSVYESGDSDAFADFVSSLSEEQIEILGLNEDNPGNPLEGKSQGGIGTTIKNWWQGTTGTGADPRASKPDAPAPAEKPAPFAGSKAAEAGATSTGIPNKPSASSQPTYSAGERASATSHLGAPSTPSSMTTADAKPSILSPGMKPLRQPDAQEMLTGKRTDQGAARFGKTGPGGAVASTNATPAGQKIAGQVAAVRAKDNVPTTGAPTSTASVPKSSAPRPGMRSGMRPGMRPSAAPKMYGAAAAGDVGASLSGSQAFREETKPQIKESFEQFLRNKFLKG